MSICMFLCPILVLVSVKGFSETDLGLDLILICLLSDLFKMDHANPNSAVIQVQKQRKRKNCHFFNIFKETSIKHLAAVHETK